MTTIRIHNAATGEIIDREMNPDELAQAAKDKEAAEAKAAAEAEAAVKRQELLDRLGITADEAKLLLG